MAVSNALGTWLHEYPLTPEKVLAALAKESSAFTVDYARVEPTDPQFKGVDGKPDAAKVDEAIKQVGDEKEVHARHILLKAGFELTQKTLTPEELLNVIGEFEGTIEKFGALATLMPIVAGIAGNSANQTTTIIIRSLALGQITQGNARRLMLKELAISGLNGLVWGGIAEGGRQRVTGH